MTDYGGRAVDKPKEVETDGARRFRQSMTYVIIMVPFLGLFVGIGAGLCIMVVTVALRWAGWVVR